MAKELVLNVLETTDFLQAITMLHTLDRRQADIAAGKEGKQVAPISAKRASILVLPLDAYGSSLKWFVRSDGDRVGKQRWDFHAAL